MYADMEFWTEVRRRVLTGQLSKRAAYRHYDLSWHVQDNDPFLNTPQDDESLFAAGG